MKGHFVIVNNTDVLLYSHRFPLQTNSSPSSTSSIVIQDTQDLNQESDYPTMAIHEQFLLFASLDILDVYKKDSTPTFCRIIERLKDAFISAYVTPGNIKFLLLHDTTNDDNIKSFFVETHEAWIKWRLNPLFDEVKCIKEKSSFDVKIRQLVRKWLS